MSVRMGTEAMTEDELLIGLTEAMTIAGWLWMHPRRSDLALTMGTQGWPDVFAIHPTRRLAMALELKRQDSRLTAEQAHWVWAMNQAGIVARVVRPTDYDLMLRVILGSGDPEQLMLMPESDARL